MEKRGKNKKEKRKKHDKNVTGQMKQKKKRYLL
jgi:hypothetical protein